MKQKIIAIVLLAVCIQLAGAANPKQNNSYRKSVSVLGDSYSAYEGYVEPNSNWVWYPRHDKDKTPNDVSQVSEMWWYQFIKDNNYKLCRLNASSGTTICYTGYNQSDASKTCFLSRMNDLGNPDILIVLGCTNDAWAGSPIGEYKWGDWKREDLFNYRPALAKLLDYLTHRYLNTEIYFVLNCDLREEINESTRTICQHYHVPCIELKGIDKQSSHPSIKGMRQIAEQLTKFVKQIK